MKKKDLLQQIKCIKNSPIICIKLLCEFLETEKIYHLELHNHVFFNDYLNFIQNVHPTFSPDEFFTYPHLKRENKKEATLIRTFISKEVQKFPIMPSYELKFIYKTINKIKEPASALAITPQGNIVSGTCYAADGKYKKGKIVLRDSSGNHIKTLIEEPASALAITPGGNIVSGTCYATDRLYNKGKIILRDPSGNRIQILVKKAASALAITPDGNIISGTCYATADVYNKGEIVCRDSSGSYMNTLIRKSASALAITPKGDMVIGTCYATNRFSSKGEIVLWDSLGNSTKTLIKKPASALVITPDGNIVIGTCYATDFVCAQGEIVIIKPTLKKVVTPPSTFSARIKELLIDNAALACIQFHKGRNESTSPVSMLPQEILYRIYSYVFPFPNMTIDKIINPNCFPCNTEKDIEKVSAADLFANKICGMKFFEKSPIKEAQRDKEQNHVNNKKCTIM